jgi:predicted GH43/DUF377 family glycosyl hydrolase
VKHIKTFACAFMIFSQFLFSDPIDLEDMAQDFVLESKLIMIPGYPDAFNPSIIPWEGGYLLSFRVIPQAFLTFHSEIGVIRLDDEFNPIGSPQILNTRESKVSIYSRAEDGRLINIDGKLWLVYTDNVDVIISKGGFRMYLAEVVFDGMFFNLQNVEAITEFEGADPCRREKNWVPFDKDNELLLAYSINPHKIFRPLIGSGACETIVTTKSDIRWDWGELRGGTQALKMSDAEYLSFFHSSLRMVTVHSDDREMPHYFMGAYTFSSEFPYELTRMSPEPIVGTDFYHGPKYKPYWGSVRVVFPCGFIFDDDFIWIVYGRQDHEVWIVKLDKQGLLESLAPVSLEEVILP